MSAPRTVLVAFVGVSLLASCGARSSTTSRQPLDNIGRIPGISGPSSTPSPVDPVLEGGVLGTLAAGNRILVIGDSILAGTAQRYGGAMCSALVPAGWRVAVEAEPSRRVTFGRKVLDARLREGWDAAVVFLGTNYGGDADAYEKDLAAIVDAFAGAPVLLLTATLYKSAMADVNTRIRTVAATRPNVSVLDWSAVSSRGGMLAADGIHPSGAGREALVTEVARAVGSPPSGTGKCLAARFTDDSSATSGAVPGSSTPSTSGPTTTVAGG